MKVEIELFYFNFFFLSDECQTKSKRKRWNTCEKIVSGIFICANDNIIIPTSIWCLEKMYERN